MVFPKSPTRNVTGKLRLSVRAPVEVRAESDTSEKNNPPVLGEDFSSQLKFKLPRGFKLSSNLTLVLSQQRDFVINQLNDLILKKENCRNCESAVSDENVSLIRHACLFVCNILANKISALPSISLNHSPNQDLTLNIKIGDKLVKLLAKNETVSAGFYINNLLSKVTEESRDLTTVVTDTINWFLE